MNHEDLQTLKWTTSARAKRHAKTSFVPYQNKGCLSNSLPCQSAVWLEWQTECCNNPADKETTLQPQSIHSLDI